MGYNNLSAGLDPYGIFVFKIGNMITKKDVRNIAMFTELKIYKGILSNIMDGYSPFYDFCDWLKNHTNPNTGSTYLSDNNIDFLVTVFIEINRDDLVNEAIKYQESIRKPLNTNWEISNAI